MEKKIELANGSKLVFTGGHASNLDGVVSVGQSGTSGGLMERFLVIKGKGTIESPLIEMDETERKFIIMSRIAVLLSRKGLIAGLTIYPSECNAGSFCQISIQDAKSIAVLESLDNHQVTEQELLDWWSAIENGVE